MQNRNDNDDEEVSCAALSETPTVKVSNVSEQKKKATMCREPNERIEKALGLLSRFLELPEVDNQRDEVMKFLPYVLSNVQRGLYPSPEWVQKLKIDLSMSADSNNFFSHNEELFQSIEVAVSELSMEELHESLVRLKDLKREVPCVQISTEPSTELPTWSCSSITCSLRSTDNTEATTSMEAAASNNAEATNTTETEAATMHDMVGNEEEEEKDEETDPSGLSTIIENLNLNLHDVFPNQESLASSETTNDERRLQENRTASTELCSTASSSEN